MKKNILLISILALIILQPGCDDPNAVTIEELSGKWYFVDGYSTTTITSDIDQEIINTSMPGIGEISITGDINSSLRFLNFDSSSIFVLTTHTLLDTIYPYGILLIEPSSDTSYSSGYLHYINDTTIIIFMGESNFNAISFDSLDNSLTMNSVTLTSFFDPNISINLNGTLSPEVLSISANTPFEFNYSNNFYNEITYFSLEFEDNGLLTGLLELNIDDVISTDTLEVTYNLFNDTLIIYNEWFLGSQVFSEIDSIKIQLSQDVDHLSLEFENKLYQAEEDTSLFSLLESIVGMEQNSLIAVQSSDSLVFSQTQPLRRITSRTNQLMPYGRKIRNIRKLLKNK
ncbi:MAG: hypothetical protein HQ509_09280 [Candidatus Marinimicrobia bacterium]|nr:hypothetical protein [Candidatus Neomarinimicrobiota bacterium]